jgi:hypothetical protein
MERVSVTALTPRDGNLPESLSMKFWTATRTSTLNAVEDISEYPDQIKIYLK